MARAWPVLFLLQVAVWAQEPTYKGRTVAQWVERLAEGDAEAPLAVHEIGAASVRPILDRLVLKAKSDDLASAITEMGAQAMPPLMDALKHGPTPVRLLALEFLVYSPHCPDDAASLVPGLLKDEDREMRVGAALRLCNAGFTDASALPPLLEGLQAGQHRAWAARLAGQFPNDAAPRVVQPLLAASRDTDKDVRRNALGSLWSFWTVSQEAQSRLLEASESKDVLDRKAAVPEWDAVPAAPEVLALCLKAANDPDPDIMRKAIDAIEWRLRRRGLGDQAEAALTHPRVEVRKLACEAVAQGDTTALPVVLGLLGDPESGVRLEALDAVVRIGDKGEPVRKRLRDLMRDEGLTKLGRHTAWALIALDTDMDEAIALLVDAREACELAALLGNRAVAAAPALREMLVGEPTEAAVALYAVTGEVEAPLRALRGELEAKYWFSRLKTCQAVPSLGPAAAPLVPQLSKCLADENEYVRQYAAVALGCVGAAAKAAIPKLIDLLDDPDACTHAAAALGWLDADTPKVKALLGAVIEAQDPNDGRTRPGALRYFWKRGLMPVEEVVERCRKSLGPPNWQDMLPILRLLGEIGPPAQAAIPDLEQLAKDRLYEIRVAAEDAIRRIRPPG